MLNIIKIKKKKVLKKNIKNINFIVKNKSSVPSIRDWKNSIYVYNKNYLSLIPIASKLTTKLIRSYFNSYNLKSEIKVRVKKRNRIHKKLFKKSLIKIYLSDGEFKHTNDKIIINLYLYNRQKINLLVKLKKFYKKTLKKKRRFMLRRIYLNRRAMSRLLNYKKLKYLVLINPSLFNDLQNKRYLIYKSNLLERKYKQRLIKKLKLCLYHKQLVYFNKLKFDNVYLQGLINLIRKIYKKNIDFNIINLKTFFANSDILIQPLKYKYRKKRKLMKYLRRFLNNIKIQLVDLIYQPNFYLNKFIFIEKKDIVNNLFSSFFFFNKINSLKKTIMSNIKYKKITGVRLSLAGRLTRRYTAARAAYKMKYQGNLKNIYASENKDRYVLLRSKLQPNLDYKKLSYKTRIGAFGLKGWVSGS
jgi:hypothetical protein